MQPKATVGDLVAVAGYNKRVFRVDAYDMNLRFESGNVAEEITYEVVCVDTGEYDLAWHENITLLTKADSADEYLRKRPDSERYKPGKAADKPHIIVRFTADQSDSEPQGACERNRPPVGRAQRYCRAVRDAGRP